MSFNLYDERNSSQAEWKPPLESELYWNTSTIYLKGMRHLKDYYSKRITTSNLFPGAVPHHPSCTAEGRGHPGHQLSDLPHCSCSTPTLLRLKPHPLIRSPLLLRWNYQRLTCGSPITFTLTSAHLSPQFPPYHPFIPTVRCAPPLPHLHIFLSV